MKRILPAGEIFIIVVIALAPLLATFPYRINIFLSWEGAYRMANGQMPYKDFGMPVGYMFWVVPAAFFKIFGAKLFTLIQAQAFLNLVAGFSFREILRTLRVHPFIQFAGVLIFCLSYLFPNYWPWYNQTVIVYEIVALAFILKFVVGARRWWGLLPVAGTFAFFSFFTKQDAGAIGFLICISLLTYDAIASRQWKPIIFFLAGFLITAATMILPLLKYDFTYWFNIGQSPHSSRLSIAEVFREFFMGSQWIKFYLLLIAVLLILSFRQTKAFWKNRTAIVFAILTLGILGEAAVFQVTSYVPPDNNIFFHSFAFCFIAYLLSLLTPLNFSSPGVIASLTLGILLWWSNSYWKYVERFILKPSPNQYTYTAYEGNRYANVVDRNTYMLMEDTADIPLHEWRVPPWPSFERVMLPGTTIDGITRLFQMEALKKDSPRVLNMTELTPLAAEVPFALETGSRYPLWFHRGVAMFPAEIQMFKNRIANKYYDVVLFEFIPYLNNFYPFELREELRQHYRLVDRFTAPRKPSSNAWIEVYAR